MIREISVVTIKEAVQQAIERCAYKLPDDYLQALDLARNREQSLLGKSIILMLEENAVLAESERLPTCQDTGMVLLFLEVGQDVHFVDGSLSAALNAAVRYAFGPLRKSVVSDPMERVNTGDNTPPIVTYDIVPGSAVRVNIMLKGFGAELMSRLRMLPPSAGVDGVKSFIVDTVEQAGPNACPPVIVGVGLGSSFDGVARLAKKALLRPLGTVNPHEHLAELERDLLIAINRLGIGPQGLGGTETALAVHVESFPTHIAALPVAVNLNCSAPRRATLVI